MRLGKALRRSAKLARPMQRLPRWRMHQSLRAPTRHLPTGASPSASLLRLVLVLLPGLPRSAVASTPGQTLTVLALGALLAPYRRSEVLSDRSGTLGSGQGGLASRGS